MASSNAALRNARLLIGTDIFIITGALGPGLVERARRGCVAFIPRTAVDAMWISLPIGLRAVLVFGLAASIGNGAFADLVVAVGEAAAAFEPVIGPNAILNGTGNVNGSSDPFAPWVMDGTVRGNSLDSPIVITGFVKGTGTFENIVFDGNYAPGHSPALVTLGNTVYTASNVLEMEIGGLLPGSQHDKIIHNGMAALGGTLDVVLINAFIPQLGNAFDLFDWNGGISGVFATINLPALGSGLTWDTSDLYIGGQLSVSAVPEVSGFLLTALCAGVGTAVATLRRVWNFFVCRRAACAAE